MNSNAIFQDLYDDFQFDNGLEIEGGAIGTAATSTTANTANTVSSGIGGMATNATTTTTNTGPTAQTQAGVNALSQLTDKITTGLTDFRNNSFGLFSGSLLPAIACIGIIASNITSHVIRCIFIVLACLVSFEIDVLITMSCFIYTVFTTRYESVTNGIVISLSLLHLIIFYSMNNLVQYNRLYTWIFGMIIIILTISNMTINNVDVKVVRDYNGGEYLSDQGYEEDNLITGGMDLLNYRID